MILPYLNFNGNCEEAFNFYAAAFGSNNLRISRLNSDPNNPVMHAMLMLTENGGISGADTEGAVHVAGMQILALLPSRERVEEIMLKLADGGSVVSRFQPHPPPDDNGGGATVIDKYGYTWFLCV